MTSEPGNGRIGRWTLAGLFALFFLPLFLAMGWYVFAPSHTPASTANGTLIDPARPLTPFRLDTADGGGLTLEDLRGRWHLVQFVRQRCGEACRQRLYETRQVRRALGKDSTRVRRLLVAAAGESTAGIAPIIEEHPALVVARGTGEGAFGRQFPGMVTANTVFVIDPLGNLMMRFDPGVSAEQMLEDLEKLLKLSRIG